MYFLACLALVAGASALIAEHEITSLPGWKDGPLPSRMWSGHIDIAEGNRSIHYWFIEAENDPQSAPVLLWTQGGPGASGMLGLLTEMGPFETKDESFDDVKPGDVPRIFRRENAWTKLVNMLFFEAPAGVGFSTCAGGNDKCPLYNDTVAADDNYEFLQRFFTAYPEFSTNEFYITGESYAGVYVPMMADRVLAKPGAIANFKGVVVGDGCLGIRGPDGKGPLKDVPDGTCGVDDSYWFSEFMYGHGQFSTKTYQDIKKLCGDALKSTLWSKMPGCKDAMARMANETGGYFVYNIFDECDGMNDLRMARARRRMMAAIDGNTREGITTTPVRGALNDYSCGSSRAMHAWLTHEKVKEALHVSGSWEEHDGWPGHYVSTEVDVRPIYWRLIKSGKRVLIYYGDVDGGVPYNGGEFWTSNFGLPELEGWRPWTVDGKRRMAGYVVRYDSGLDFVTIRGAGHMVPTYKPLAAIVMLAHWLENYPLPQFDPLAPTIPPIALGAKKDKGVKQVAMEMQESHFAKTKAERERLGSLEMEVTTLRALKAKQEAEMSELRRELTKLGAAKKGFLRDKESRRGKQVVEKSTQENSLLFA